MQEFVKPLSKQHFANTCNCNHMVLQERKAQALLQRGEVRATPEWQATNR
jgi:hypothetical protein